MSVIRNAAKAFTANTLPSSLFRRDIDTATARALFRRYVRQVEIENHNYCNRTCWFCPNTRFDRRSTTQLMTDEVFEKILAGLESIDYDQTLIWSRYHEVMAHPSFFDRLLEARRRLPRARLVAISNGDYLDRNKLRRLEEARLDRLLLDLYLPEGKERDEAELARAVKLFEERTGLQCVPNGSGWEFICTGSTVRITMGVPNYSFNTGISTRGGLVEISELRDYTRHSVCFRPLHSVTIDFNGKGMLCCEVRSDAPEHAGAIVGDLSQRGYSLFDYYRDQAPARLALLSPGPKQGACASCNAVDGGPDRMARRPLVAAVLSRLWPLGAIRDWGLNSERDEHLRR